MIEKLAASGFLLEKLKRAGASLEVIHRRPDAAAQAASVESLAAELAATEPDAAVGAEIVTLLAAEAPEFFRGRRPARRSFSPPFACRSGSGISRTRTSSTRSTTRSAPRRSRASCRRRAARSSRSAAAAGARPKRRCGASARASRAGASPSSFRRSRAGANGRRAPRPPPETRVEAAKLDMTKPWDAQGIVPGSFDAVYSVNCFHVAPDLAFVLGQAKAALKPGGVVVVSECVKPGRIRRPLTSISSSISSRASRT